MLNSKRFLLLAATVFLFLCLSAGEYEDAVAKVEKWITATYQTPRAKKSAEKKLDKIIESSNDEASKIAALKEYLSAVEYEDAVARVEKWMAATYQTPRAKKSAEKKLDKIVDSANDEASKIAVLKETFPEAWGGFFPYTILLPGNVKLSMVKIKAGTFTMGSPVDELGRSDDEKQHRVTLTKDYWLGKYEVTQGQWEAVMGHNPSHFKKGDNYPVEQVSWYDAKKFCNRMNKLYVGRLPKGYRFDLPTEAQWEYACRAGTTTALNSGRDLTSETGTCSNLDEVGWYGENSDSSTHPVGRKRPNAWGLYDMHGNVWEWCRDGFDDYGGDATDPSGSGSERVDRGGSWLNYAGRCRSAGRDIFGTGDRRSFLGFRLALVPVQ